MAAPWMFRQAVFHIGLTEKPLVELSAGWLAELSAALSAELSGQL
jgi:hypothetical protein